MVGCFIYFMESGMGEMERMHDQMRSRKSKNISDEKQCEPEEWSDVKAEIEVHI